VDIYLVPRTEIVLTQLVEVVVDKIMNDIVNLDKLPKGNRTKIVITNLNKDKWI